MNYGVPQGSVLGLLLFSYDLHDAIKYNSTQHFADDRNLLLSDYSLKKIAKTS